MKLKAFYTSNTNKEEAHSYSGAGRGLSCDVRIVGEGTRHTCFEWSRDGTYEIFIQQTSREEIMMKDEILNNKSEKLLTLSLPPSKQPAQSENAFNQVIL